MNAGQDKTENSVSAMSPAKSKWRKTSKIK
jgi:hypothetical protein